MRKQQRPHPVFHLRNNGATVKLLTLLISVCIWCIPSTVTAEPSADPSSLGMGNARMVHGGGSNAATLNPAILGAQLEPWGGAQLFPLVNSYTAGYWSDKLALTPYREYFSIDEDGQWQKIVTQIIGSSFNVAGKSPAETSRRITRKIDGGASVYSGAGLSLLGATIGNVAVDVRTSVDARVDIPEAPFLLLFSEDNGLRPGADLSMTHLGAHVAALTDINLGYGMPLDLSGITGRINGLLHEVTDLKYAAWGAGLTVSLGHGYLDLTTSDGAIRYADDGSHLSMDVDATLRTTGTGLSGNYAFGNPYEDGFSFSGWGAGINAGILLYGERTSVSVALRRLGPMIWNNVLEGDVSLRTQDLTVAGLFENSDIDVFDSTNGGTLPDENSSLRDIGTILSWQPTRLNIGLGYRFNFRHLEKKGLRALSEYLNTAFEYEQSLAPWPTRSFIPRVALGAENGFLWGFFPVRAGFIFGGAERVASTFGFSLGPREFNLQVAYEAIGTPYWYPKRGFEVAAGFSTEWKKYRDPDRDGISDRKDRCPYEPEGVDGFEDEDGCPDPDNDADGIADSIDKCINVAEDRDGFEDDDGCPDPDNDRDSVADSTDHCPTTAEDLDGFEDTDGCPDFDNDKDGIPDSTDRCPDLPEGGKGTADHDGCPTTDSDNDAIVDSLDRCPQEAEIFNFVDDEDGCPDTAGHFSPEQTAGLTTQLPAVRFDAKGALTQKALPALDTLGTLLASIPTQHYLLCWKESGQPDSICRLRAETVANQLAARGIGRDRVAIPAEGCTAGCNEAGLCISVAETVEVFKAATAKKPAADTGAAPPAPAPSENPAGGSDR
ncbi:MAG: thrombospondin type 3 repeat-containing protein [Chitinispirillaceae bacterium]|nr:thrombospondin type 3 repeat-containing protein [Chitinispirillaceae bacterium]